MKIDNVVTHETKWNLPWYTMPFKYIFFCLFSGLILIPIIQWSLYTLAKWKIHWKLLKQALNSFIAPYTGFLKSWNFFYTLAILKFMMLHCYSKKNNPVSLALRQRHFRVTRISFYIQIPHRFWNSVNYLIETTKCIPTVINEMRDADNLDRNPGWKNESL